MTNVDHPPMFKEGVRVLLLMLRSKDGGSARTDRKAVKKIVTTNPQEFDQALKELRAKWDEDERIYSTINPRNLEKAIRIFKYRQLDADYFATVDKEGFYLDLENRWISSLKDGKASSEQFFLVDVDEVEGVDVAGPIYKEIEERNLWVMDSYRTRNGQHIILKPFNPAIVSFPVMKNSLMLWSY